MRRNLPTEHLVPTTETTFAALGVSPPILKCLANVGFVHPTPIQAQVVPEGLAGRDLIGCAQTGTGKTAAFVLPLAERLHHGRGVRAVILCPTREIALQTQAFLELFGQDHHLASVVLIGGVRIAPQITALKKQPDILVATPGRLNDHLERKTVSLKGVTEVVFDEADRMLDMGFLPQIEAIMRHVPASIGAGGAQQRHTMMFSATMPHAVAQLARRYLHEPVRVDVAPPGTTAEGIEHRLYLVDPLDKRKAIVALLQCIAGSTLVFTRMRQDVDRLERFLSLQHGEPSAVLHSDRTQRERTEALQAFRDERVRILIATDLAARGIDIPHITHVINYDVPDNPEDYVHRAGRTARFGGTGIASTIASWMDRAALDAIERQIGAPLPRCALPDVVPFVEKQVLMRGRRAVRGRRRLR